MKGRTLNSKAQIPLLIIKIISISLMLLMPPGLFLKKSITPACLRIDNTGLTATLHKYHLHSENKIIQYKMDLIKNSKFKAS